jgi:indolepyruvate ferredoxin oxidoreductase alpha subunit
VTIMGVCLDKPGARVPLTGNEAVARGALEAGIAFVASYPGSPTAEVPGTLARIAQQFDLYVEWSSNEKVAMEGAAAASFAGLRSLAVMKVDGLNVAMDFASALSISGCRGGMVIMVGDDPGSHSSIREEDSRNICKVLHFPVLEPSTVQMAKDLTLAAFTLSESLGVPVVLRCVSRICHGNGAVLLGEIPRQERKAIFPKTERMIAFSIQRHALQEEKLVAAAGWAEDCRFNRYEGPKDAKKLVISSGPSAFYAREGLQIIGIKDSVGVLEVATVWPLPPKLLLKHLKHASEVVFAEDVEPFLEDNVMALSALHWNDVGPIKFYGKRSGDVTGPNGPGIGELNPEIMAASLARIFHISYQRPGIKGAEEFNSLMGGALPSRELALCPGCPHRASMWAIKTALELDGREGILLGDIGCFCLGIGRTGYYLLQTLHCMGGGIGLASGMGQLSRFGLTQPVVTVLGDSTFFHAALPGLINAHYHHADMLCVLLDNGTTAMTGHQPHPGCELTALGELADTVSLEGMLVGMGIPYTVGDPYNVGETIDTICRLLQEKGTRVLILRCTCALLAVKGKSKNRVYVDSQKCIGDECGCSRFCSRVFSCPANIWDEENGRAKIDETLCNGCGVCASICPKQAIIVEKDGVESVS